MTKNTFAEELVSYSTEELQELWDGADFALDPSPLEVRGAVMGERIRRHALVCQDLECGFNPMA